MCPDVSLLDEMFNDFEPDETQAAFSCMPLFIHDYAQKRSFMSATREDRVHMAQFGRLITGIPDRLKRVELVVIMSQSNIAGAVNELWATHASIPYKNSKGYVRGFEHLGFTGMLCVGSLRR